MPWCAVTIAWMELKIQVIKMLFVWLSIRWDPSNVACIVGYAVTSLDACKKCDNADAPSKETSDRWIVENLTKGILAMSLDTRSESSSK